MLEGFCVENGVLSDDFCTAFKEERMFRIEQSIPKGIRIELKVKT